MRIKINFSPNKTPVPIANQSLLNSYVHKCLGRNNEYHDARSNYNISSLYGGKLRADKETLDFENGGYIVASSQDTTFINLLLMGLINNLEFTHGMTFAGVDHINESFIDGWNHFATLSPFLIKKYKDRSYSFLTLKDEDFKGQVKEYLVKKLSQIDETLDLRDFDVNIPDNATHKVKGIRVKNVVNQANQCHISIHSNKKVVELLYNIGIGQSTGSGFGTIYKTENRQVYHLG